MLRRLVAPSLLRTLVIRSMSVTIVALVLVSGLAIYLSNDLLETRFEHEAETIAGSAQSDINERIVFTTRNAAPVGTACPRAPFPARFSGVRRLTCIGCLCGWLRILD